MQIYNEACLINKKKSLNPEKYSENVNPFANTLLFFLKIVDLFAELDSILLLINEHPLGVVHSLVPKNL